MSGDVVLDPFAGSGTTPAVARKLGRQFIGIERDPDYAAIARDRVEGIEPPTDTDLVDTPIKREEPRVPFGWLVERGLVRVGDVLTDSRRRYAARVRADGTLATTDFKGSIHQVGAHVQSAPACNGWQFWCREERGALVPIDVYRQKLRAEIH